MPQRTFAVLASLFYQWQWQLSPPFLRGRKKVVIHVITSITGVKTIKRQIRAAYGCTAAGQSVSEG